MNDLVENPLGIALDDENPRERVPLIVLYGEPKIGKSTEFAKAFSRCLWLTSDETVLRGYASWYALNEDEARGKGMLDPRVPYTQGGMAKKTLPATEADGITPFNTWGTVKTIIDRYLKAVAENTCPFDGLVIDEWTTIADRIYQNMMAACEDKGDSRFKTKHNKPDRFGPPREIIAFTNWICSVPRAKPGCPAKLLGLICHPEDPQVTDGVKGGPKCPTAKSRRVVCARADAILRIYVERLEDEDGGADALGFDGGDDILADAPKDNGAFLGEYVSAEGLVRRIQTELSPIWEAGIRDFEPNPVVKLDLRELLESCGFTL
jgi:hypothetical protein